MNEKLLHTPEGVRDLYNSECKKKLALIDQIHHVLGLYGYQDIDTPSFEYFDIFNFDKGSAASNEMYKFFDRNNNTLVLRPDFTPGIARCVAKYYADTELPIRLCYHGNTFINAHQHQGKLSEFTQIGGELVNDDSSAADAETIACVVNCLLALGLKEFQIEIGDVGYFKGLVAEAGLDEETESKLKNYIHMKNFFGLSEYVAKLDISDNLKKAFAGFDTLFGGLEMLDKADSYVTNDISKNAIKRLREVYQALSSYGYDKYVGFDLSMVNRYHYYTGIVFRGYTYGTGDAIVKGGRYDNLLSKFGKNAPSVGFAIYVDDLLNAINRNKIDVAIDTSDIMLVYKDEYQAEAIALATKLRQKNQKVDLTKKSEGVSLEEYVQFANKMHYAGMYEFVSKNEVMVYGLANTDGVKQSVDAL